MKKYVIFLEKNVILFSSFILFLVVCILANTFFKQDFSFLTQTFNYKPQYAYDLMNRIGEEGRKAHLFIFISDLLMIFFYTNFLIGANYRVYKNRIKKCSILSIITFSPVILALVQLAEIIVLTILIINFKSEYSNIARLSNCLTVIKYYLLVICFCLPILGLCANIIFKIGKRMRRIAD